MAIETNAYEYAPLPGENFIRILIIFPSTDTDSAIEATIEIANLDTAEYNALSYTWAMQNGDASWTRTMRIDGNVKPITQNLYEGLKRIRMETEPLRIWIDAVCINQSDKQEQSAQVARMADIYRNAARVLIWLGEGESEAADAAVYESMQRIVAHLQRRKECGLDWTMKMRSTMDFSCSFCCLLDLRWDCRCTFNEAERSGMSASAREKFRATQKLLQARDGETDLHEDRPSIPADVFALDGISPVAMDLGLSIHRWLNALFKSELFLDKVLQLAHFVANFFGRRYWFRRWVVQEICLAKDLRCCWGRFQVNLNDEQTQCFLELWSNLDSCLEYLVKYRERAIALRSHAVPSDDGFRKSYRHIQGLLSQRTVLLEEPARRTDILEWIAETNISMCYDPRDLVYALLGLCKTTISPDYSLSTAQVFAQATKSIIREGYLNVVLAHVRKRHRLVPHAVGDTVATELASWVPDLRQHFHRQVRFPSEREQTQNINFVGDSVLQCRARVWGMVENGIDQSRSRFWLRHNRNDCVQRSRAIETPALSPPSARCPTPDEMKSAQTYPGRYKKVSGAENSRHDFDPNMLPLPEVQMYQIRDPSHSGSVRANSLPWGMAPGDVVCSINQVFRPKSDQYLLVLRPEQDLSSTYKIVGLIDTYSLTVDKEMLTREEGWTCRVTEDISRSVEADIRIV